MLFSGRAFSCDKAGSGFALWQLRSMHYLLPLILRQDGISFPCPPFLDLHLLFSPSKDEKLQHNAVISLRAKA
jgi:hypothetical protein